MQRPFRPPNPSGKCMCGCGETTSITTRAIVKLEIEKGQHHRYIRGHSPRTGRRTEVFHRKLNRWFIYERGTRRYRYRVVAEQMIGRPLGPNEVVHHINGDPTDDRPQNLKVMTRAEHGAMHSREMGLRPPPPRSYTDGELLDALRRWVDEHQRRPRQRDIDRDPRMPDSTTYRLRFGNWPAAVNAALS